MFGLKKTRSVSSAIALAMAVVLALSSVTLADHSHKRGRPRDKQAEKFINGHDARDGRWDGRGPRVRDRRGRWDDDFCCDDRRPRRKPR
jgi:hypothetical protein